MAMIKRRDQKRFGEVKVCFILHSQAAIDHGGKSGHGLRQVRNLAAGADAKAKEDGCLLVCPSLLFF